MSRYSKSDRDIYMEVLKPSMGAGAYIKDFRKSDAPQFKGKTEKEKDKMAVAAYLDAKDEMAETKLPPHLAKLFDKDGNFKDKKKQAMFDKMQKAARKGIKFTSKDVTPKGFGPDEGIEEQKKPSMQALFALIADTKNAQEGIAKIMKALKVDEKKASRIMDKIIAAALKGEELGEHHEKDENGNVIEHCLDCDPNPCTCENKELDEAIKYTYVAVDDKGKIIGFSGGSKAAADAKDMARRNNGVVHKLKKPMSQKVGDMEINRPFNPVLKAEVDLDEKAKLNVYRVSSSRMQGNVHAKDEKEAEKIAKSKGMKGKIQITDMGPYKGQPRLNAQKEKAEVEEDTIEESAMLNLATVKFQAKEKLGKIAHKVTQKGRKYIISVDSNDEEDAQKAMKDHPLYAAGKLRVVPESFYTKVTGLEPIKENRAKRDAMKAMGRRRGKDPADVDTDATDDDVKAASKNIIMQLRKAVSMRGQKDVEFDKEKKKVPANIAQAALDKMARMKTSIEKGVFSKKISKSYRDLLNAVKEK